MGSLNSQTHLINIPQGDIRMTIDIKNKNNQVKFCAYYVKFVKTLNCKYCMIKSVTSGIAE